MLREIQNIKRNTEYQDKNTGGKGTDL